MVQASRRIPSIVLALAVVATAIKLVLAARTIGTNDARTFWYFLQEYRGSGAKVLYEKDADFNHPPFILHWLTGLRWLWLVSGQRPWFFIRLPSILADVGSVWLVARLLGSRVSEPANRWTLCLVAAAPVSIMVSGFHGNNDPVMIFFLLLSLYLLDKPAPDWVAGIAMGMAVNIKVVPLVFWPAVFLWLPSWRRRWEYFGVAALVVVLASTPLIFQAPALLARKVLGYPSSYGLWGISRILTASPSLETFSKLFESQGRIVLVATLLGLSVWMNRRTDRPPLFRQIGVLAFAFLTVTPGFGVQYLAWLVPWIACLELGTGVFTAVAWTLSSGAFLVLVYTYWCQGTTMEQSDPNWLGRNFWSRGLPWNFADANTMYAWWGPIVSVEIACWVSVVAVFAAQLRGMARTRASARDTPCRFSEAE